MPLYDPWGRDRWAWDNGWTYQNNYLNLWTNNITWTLSGTGGSGGYFSTSSSTTAGGTGWVQLGYLNEYQPVLPTPAWHREATGALEREQQRAERARTRTEAVARAQTLLLSLLPPDQREAYAKTGSFEVVGSLGNRYRINNGVSGNVVYLGPDGARRGVLCAHPDMISGWLPTPDVMLAQMLALTTDEAAFLAVANLHQGARPPQAPARRLVVA